MSHPFGPAEPYHTLFNEAMISITLHICVSALELETCGQLFSESQSFLGLPYT
jgi:hypothetical protein